MNIGTKIRTIARVVASLNTAVYAVSAGIAGLGINKLTIAWAVVTIVVDFLVAFFTTYFNNDYTDAGAIGTKVCRQIKADEENGDLTLHDEIERLIGGDENDD